MAIENPFRIGQVREVNSPTWKQSILSILIFLLFVQNSVSDSSTATCSAGSNEETCVESNESHNDDNGSSLTPMPYDLGYGTEFFDAYVVPDVSSFYQLPSGTKKMKIPHFRGFAGKFINMSPEKMHLLWEAGDGRTSTLIAAANPFSAVGTGTFPSHEFYFTPASGSNKESIKHRFNVVPDENIYVFDPYITNEEGLELLSPEQFDQYMTLKHTLNFTLTYKKFTGRDWLSRFPRKQPKHHIWEAKYFGQKHQIETLETHFTSLPPDSLLGKGDSFGVSDDQRKAVQPYRSPEKSMNLTLEVISCAPRAYEIKNFLSPVEVQHVLKLATGLTLSLSTVSGGDTMAEKTDTRTSTNSWVYREHSPIVDAIYRRAADLLRIDEALLRHRRNNEVPDYPSREYPSRKSIAEPLQLVHYDVGQQYTAHHDFGYAATNSPYQGARFATLLLYLNEGMEGGATTFPRAMNAETSKPFSVTPELGKAVLFYSFLPDGNLDDLSQHEAEPVRKGEKWLMNLWVWDPVFD